MNKVIIGIIGSIVIVLGIYFATAQKGTDSTQDQTNNTQTQQETGNNTQDTSNAPSSMKELLSADNQTCTYTDGQNTGTVYAANGKVRMDMTSVTNGVSINTNAIMDSQTYYSWVDDQPNGFKFHLGQSTTGSAGSNQNVDINKEFDYTCSDWNVDVSKFELPAGVTFSDYTTMQAPGM
jgi:cytoskeletal protein RodZ